MDVKAVADLAWRYEQYEAVSRLDYGEQLLAFVPLPEESWEEALHQDNPKMFGTERVCAGRWRCPPCGKEVDYGHLCSGKHLNEVYSCWVAICKTEPAPVNVNLLTLPTDPEKPKPTPLAIEDEDAEGEAEPQAPGPLRRPPAASCSAA